MSSPTATRPRPDLGVARVEWADLGPEFVRQWGYRGGRGNRFEPEHLTVYGKTGSGKTYFINYILRVRGQPAPLGRGSSIVIVSTKRTDRTMREMGWPIITDWPPGYGQSQVIYHAPAKGLDAEHLAPQRAKVRKLMNALWHPGSNTVVSWDELWYLENNLKLKAQLETFYREGRSYGITNVASMQRPTGVTRAAHSEAGWTVSFPPKDVDDRNRVAEVFGDRRRFAAVLDSLDRTKREFLIRDDLTGEAYITHLPPPRKSNRSGVSPTGGQAVSSPKR